MTYRRNISLYMYPNVTNVRNSDRGIKSCPGPQKEPGVLVFFETEASGDCLGCSSLGIINACDHNVPFETAMIIGASSACPSHAKKMTAGEVLDNSTSLCQTPHKFDTSTIGGSNYNISHLPLEELVDDLVADLPGHKLLQKWSLDQDKGVIARDVNPC